MWNHAFFNLEGLDDVFPRFEVEVEDRLVLLHQVGGAGLLGGLLAFVRAHGLDGIWEVLARASLAVWGRKMNVRKVGSMLWSLPSPQSPSLIRKLV